MFFASAESNKLLLASAVAFILGAASMKVCSILTEPNVRDLLDLEDSDDENDETEIVDNKDNGYCKMVLVVRTDLGMSKGKVAAQCSHAAVGCYRIALNKAPNYLSKWAFLGQAKITLQAHSELELNELKALASKAGLVNILIHDAGRTQIAAGSATVLGIGPGPASIIDKVTGKLKLY
ncbi:putative aminoacyl-tRNA hydrolase [Dipodascopsis uninucleata]